MKVLHLTTSVSKHSACARISDALIEQGIDSKILVLNKNGQNKNEVGVNNKYKKKINELLTYLERKYISSRKAKVEPVFSISVSSINIMNNKLVKEADIIHLHWFNWGLLKVKDIYKLSKSGKKIVWTMHDSWGFTGGCHIRYGCDKYINGCNKCFMLNSSVKKDLSYFLWRQKKKYYNRSDFTVVVPSKMHKEYACKSNLLSNKKICVINNPINTKKYKPINRNTAREILDLPQDKLLILFGAVNAKNSSKGYEYLIETLRKYKTICVDVNNIEIVIFGANEFSEIESLGYNTTCVGRINDEITMNLLYSASDLFISPSIEESFGQTFLESIVSGTPAIGFEKTGCEDIIDHLKNGYLAKFKDSDDILSGMNFIFENLDFEFNAKKFGYEYISKQYIQLYKDILS